MTYDTLNPVPSIDPRDLDDNAQVFDSLLNSDASSVPDRQGVSRKSWHQMELDAAALVSPNVSALAAVAPAVDKGVFFNSLTPVGMGTYTLTSFVRSLGDKADSATYRAAIGALSASDTAAYAGSASKLTTPRTLAITGDGTWNVSFDGSANASAALTLANTGVTAGTYGAVTVNAKGLVTSASAQTPIANGGTGAATAAAARTNLGVLAAADKPAWTSYTPTVTATTNTFTAASATGKYLVLFGICYIQVAITVTTKGTGALANFTLPLAALSGSAQFPIPARESVLNGKVGCATIAPGLTTAVCTDSANADLVTGNGAVINIMGSYPIA